MRGRGAGAGAVITFSVVTAGCVSTTIYPTPGMSAWTEATTEHFVVQAEAPEEETAEAAQTFERAYDGYAKVVFAGLPAPPRLHVRLFRHQDAFEAMVGPARAFYLSQDEPLEVGPQPLLVSYIFHRHRNVRRAPAVQMGLAAYLTGHYYPNAPPWLRSGLPQFYQTASINWGEFSLGAPPDAFWYDGPVDAARARLRGGSALTFMRAELPRVGDLLALDPMHYEVFEQRRPNKTMVLNLAASWALVHTLAMPWSPLHGRFQAYLSALRRGEDPEDAWRSQFGSPEVRRTLDEAYEAELRQPQVTRAPLSYEPAGTAEARTRALPEFEAHRLLAQSAMLYATNDAQALSHLATAHARSPSSPEPYLLRSILFARQGRQAEALADKRKALELSGGDQRYRLALAEHLLWLEHCEGSPKGPSAELKALVEALRPSIKEASAHRWLARYEALWGAPEQALAHAREAARLDPPCGACFEVAAAALLRQGARSAAIDSQRQALRRTMEAEPYERRLAWLKVLEGATNDASPSALSLPLPRSCPLPPAPPAEHD